MSSESDFLDRAVSAFVASLMDGCYSAEQINAAFAGIGYVRRDTSTRVAAPDDPPRTVTVDLLQAAIDASRRGALEEAAQVCEGEYLNEPQAGTEDIAYDHAVRDCAAAIRDLITKGTEQ